MHLLIYCEVNALVGVGASLLTVSTGTLHSVPLSASDLRCFGTMQTALCKQAWERQMLPCF